MIKTFKFKNILFLFFLLIVSPIVFFACSQVTTSKVFENAISEIDETFFYAKNSEFVFNFISGKRENDFSQNGRKTELIDFGVLTLKPINKQVYKNLTFEMTVNENIFKGTFELNPIDNSLVFDIKTKAKVDDIVNVTIKTSVVSTTIIMQNVMDKKSLKQKDAIKKTKKEFKNLIKQKTINGKLDGEISVRILINSESEKLEVAYYITLIDIDSNLSFLLIDANAKQILAKQI
jgi:hypothetical protein